MVLVVRLIDADHAGRLFSRDSGAPDKRG